MSLLAWITLGYVAVLVLALAVSLTAIWIQLRRTGRALDGAKAALGVVRERTEPLYGPLSLLRDATGELAEDFEAAGASLGALDARLEAVAERLGLRQTAG